MENFKHTDLTERIIKSAYEVYNYFGGPGFLESVYEKALAIELRKNDLKVETQFPVSVFYKSDLVGDFRPDLLVNDTIIVELKSVCEIQEIHEVQLVNYLRATPIEVGCLSILETVKNFKLKEGYLVIGGKSNMEDCPKNNLLQKNNKINKTFRFYKLKTHKTLKNLRPK